MLIGLLVLAQIVLFAVAWLGPWRDPPEVKSDNRLPLQVRILLSFSLVVGAVLLWPGGLSQAPVYSQWIMFGMAASFIGDLVMARLIPTPNRLIGGMVAFAIAHGLYITGYIQMMQSAASADYSRWMSGLVAGVIVFGLIAILGWRFLVRNPAKPAAINIGALVYALWISTMASFALALAGALAPFWLTAVGGLLFIASDFIIGLTDIRGIRLKNAGGWVWLTYLAGQMGIIYAGWLA